MENLTGDTSEREKENACSHGNGGFQKNSCKSLQKESEIFMPLKSKGFTWEFMWLTQKRDLL